MVRSGAASPLRIHSAIFLVSCRRFKALEHIVTLQFQLGNQEAMAERYQEMLNYMGSVTRNECTDSINRSVPLYTRCLVTTSSIS